MSERRVVVPFGGGLGSAVLVARHARAGDHVLAVTVDLGGADPNSTLGRRARALGAADHLSLPGQPALATRLAIWLTTAPALPRDPLLAPPLVREALAEVLLDAATTQRAQVISLPPHADPLARALRARDPQHPLERPLAPNAGPDDLRAYLSEHELRDHAPPDDLGPRVESSLWGELADADHPDIREDPWDWIEDQELGGVIAPSDADALSEEVDVEFRQGLPVATSGHDAQPGRDLDLDLWSSLGRFAARHGIGQGCGWTPRSDGPPQRVVYAAPAFAVVAQSLQALHSVTLTPTQHRLRDLAATHYAELLTHHHHADPARADLDALLRSLSTAVSGHVRLRALHGRLDVLDAQPTTAEDPPQR